MITLSTIVETNNYVKELRSLGKTIGFVPTMGALHQGHLELMRRAKTENDILVVSIFVNPIQFNNPTDLEKYPRDLQKDAALLKSVGCNILFAPSVTEMYPKEVTKKYDFGLLETVMEGKSRPGHFNGVAVVVDKLLKITLPHKAYFGEKDFQQLAIINKLVEINEIPVKIIACPTVRESDGLAMSSRNERLTSVQKTIAPLIYIMLKYAKSNYKLKTLSLLKQEVVNMFNKQQEFDLEYFEIADDKNLQPITKWNPQVGTIAFIVVKMGNVRLIDNIRII